MKLAFLDTETTGLAEDCDIWEIGFILRTIIDLSPEDGVAAQTRDLAYCWRIVPDMTNAEPTGLRIGRYYERMGDLAKHRVDRAQLIEHPDEYPHPLGIADYKLYGEMVAAEVARLLDGVTIVGAVPDFDSLRLGRWLRRHNQVGTWHYHLVDVETLAAGRLQLPPPWNFDDLLAKFGLTYDEADRHTALGDARMVRNLFDAVMAPTEVQ